MARAESQVAVDVSADTMRVGDEIHVGGLQLRVLDLNHLSGGAKRVMLSTGDVLTLRPTTNLTVLRTVPGWEGR